MTSWGITPILTTQAQGRFDREDWREIFLQTLEEQNIPRCLFNPQSDHFSFELIWAFLEHDFMEKIGEHHHELLVAFRYLGMTYVYSRSDVMDAIIASTAYWGMVGMACLKGRRVEARIKRSINEQRAVFDGNEPVRVYELISWDIKIGVCKLKESSCESAIEVEDIEAFQLLREPSVIKLMP